MASQRVVRRWLMLAAAAFVAGLLFMSCSGAAPQMVPIDNGNPVAGGAAPTSAPAAPVGEAAGSAAPTAASGGQNQINDTAYIVREGSLDVEVADLTATLQRAQGIVIGLGGYISGSQEQHISGAQSAAVTYRVPVEHWYDALGQLRGLGTKVLAENTKADDVTGDVFDLDARLANLRSAESQYQAIMLQAKTIDDVLKVQAQLNDVRGQIEQLQGQRDNLANRAALATLTVNWQVPVAPTPSPSPSPSPLPGWNFGGQVQSAFDTLVQFGQGVATVLIWLVIVVMPIAIPIGLLALIGVHLFRPRPNRVTMEPKAPATES